MKLVFFIAILISALFYACSPEGTPVQWTEPGAKWEGRLKSGSAIGEQVVYCCEPGSNCAKKGIRELQTIILVRNYVETENLKGYFENENWEADFPELIDRPDIVEYIKTNNPKCRFVSNGEGGESFVVFKDRNQPELGTANILFAISTRADEPCPGDE